MTPWPPVGVTWALAAKQMARAGLHLIYLTGITSSGQITLDTSSGAVYPPRPPPYRTFSPSPHQDVVITVESLYQGTADPIEGVRVYLFKESGMGDGHN